MMRVYKLILMAFFATISMQNYAQNRYEEVIPCNQIDGNIVLKATINNKEYNFLFDTRVANTVVSADVVKELGVMPQSVTKSIFLSGDTISAGGILSRMTIGKNIFVQNQKVSIIKNKYLTEKNIAGIFGLKPSLGYVLTINLRDKNITTSIPYKPEYISIKRKMPTTSANALDITVASKTVSVLLDLNAPYLLSLTNDAYEQVKDSLQKNSTAAPEKKWYRNETLTGLENGVLPCFNMANFTMKSNVVYKNKAKYSSLGGKILDYGVLSIDMIHSSLYFEPYESLALPAVKAEIAKPSAVTAIAEEHGKVINLTRDYFLQNVCNYRNSSQWKYLGK